jgi:hypothetical protein
MTKMTKASNDIAFRLSRVEAEGWKRAQLMMADDAPSADEDRIAALNPYTADPARARWRIGFRNALEAGGHP